MLPFLRPHLPPLQSWGRFLEDSYREGRFSNFGPCVRRLEGALAARYGDGARDAVLVSSCTSGLTLALMAHGVRGRVVVPAFTFPATAQAVLAAGCEPVFVDVDPQSCELDREILKATLEGDRTIQAVIHVRAYGFCREIGPSHELCRARGIPFIIDAAAALGGATASGEKVGRMGDVEVFSLHATKVFGIGEGGLVLAARPVAEAVRRSSNFGLKGGTVASPGFNGKLSEFAAAVGLALLDAIDGIMERRASVASRYEERLGGRAPCGLPWNPGQPPWQTFPICVPSLADDDEAEALVAAFRACGVEVRRYYAPALHETPFFARFARGSLVVSESLAKRMICLPVYSDMAESEQDQVADAAITLLGDTLG